MWDGFSVVDVGLRLTCAGKECHSGVLAAG